VTEIHLDLQTLTADVLESQPLVECGVGASTSTAYRLLPPKAENFYLAVQAHHAKNLISDCATLDDAQETLSSFGAGITKRVPEGVSTVEDIGAALIKRKDTLTVLAEIQSHCETADLDAALTSQVLAKLSDPAALEEVVNLMSALEPTWKPSKGKRPDVRVLLMWGGDFLHLNPSVLAWHQQPPKETKKTTERGSSGICVRCGEHKQFSKKAGARIKGCVPGAGMGGTPHQIVAACSWGVDQGYNDRICPGCWESDIKTALAALDRNTIGMQSKGLYLSVWPSGDGAVQRVSGEFLDLCIAWTAKDVHEMVSEQIWGKGQGPEVERVAGDVRVCLWRKQNSTACILQYWSLPDTAVYQAMLQFRIRFPRVSINSLMQVTSPGNYVGRRWEFQPTLQGQARWMGRLLTGTPTTRTEAHTALRTYESILLRELPRDWVYHMTRKIMSDYISTDPQHPAYLLGALYAWGETMAETAVRRRAKITKDTRSNQRRIFFRKFFRTLQTRPARTVPLLKQHILRFDRQGHTEMRAYQEIRQAWEGACSAITDVPTSMDLDDKFQFQQGYDQAMSKARAVLTAKFDALPKTKETKAPTKAPTKADESDNDFKPCG